MRYLGKVCHKHLVGDGLSECDRQVELCFLELLRVQDAFHRHVVAFLVRHLNADSALTGYRSDNTDAQSRQTKGDIVLKAAYLGYSYTLSWCNLVQRDGRTDCCLYLSDFYAETLEHSDDFLVVCLYLLHVHVRLSFVVVTLEEVQSWALVSCERFERVNGGVKGGGGHVLS